MHTRRLVIVSGRQIKCQLEFSLLFYLDLAFDSEIERLDARSEFEFNTCFYAAVIGLNACARITREWEVFAKYV